MKYLILLLASSYFLFANTPPALYESNPGFEKSYNPPEASSLNVHMIGVYPFMLVSPLSCECIKICDTTYVFVAKAGGVYIYRIDDPREPVRISDTIRPLFSYALPFFNGNHLFCPADNRGIYIYDVSNPHRIIELPKISPPPLPVAEFYCAASESCFLFASFRDLSTPWDSTHIFIYDISNIINPTLLGSISISDLVSHAGRFQLKYPYLLVDGSSKLTIIDISNPSEPRVVATHPFEDSYDIVIRDTLLFASFGYTDTTIQIFNFANPSQLRRIGYWRMPCESIWWVGNLRLKENELYFLGKYRLWTLDISDVSNPTLLSSLELDTVYSLSILDTIVCACGGLNLPGSSRNLYTINVSNPLNPEILSRINFTKYYIVDLKVSNSNVFLSGWEIGDNGILIVIDVSTPEFPRWRSSLKLPTPAGYIQIQYPYAFITPDLFPYPFSDSDSGFFVVNISNPDSLRLVAKVLQGSYPWSLLVKDTLAFVTCGSENKLKVLDIRDPTQPQLIGEISISFAFADRMFLRGNYLYATFGAGGSDHWVSIFDISNPTQPSELGMYRVVSSYARITSIHVPTDTIAVISIHDYVSGCDGFMEVLDVSNPAHPYFISRPGLSSWQKYDIYATRDYAYLVGMDGFYVIDIRNPSMPIIAGHYVTSNYWCKGHSIEVEGDYIYTDEPGLLICQFDSIAAGVKNKIPFTGINSVIPTVVRKEIKLKLLTHPLKLDIYDISGRRLKSFNFRKGHKKNEVFKINGLNSGVYFLSLRRDNMVKNIKVLLLK